MKTRLVDLNKHLFATLERLNEEGLDPEKVKVEIERSKAVAEVGGKIIEIAKVALEAEKAKTVSIPKDNLPVYFDQTPPPPLEIKNAN